MTKIAHLSREHNRDNAAAERDDEKLTRVARATITTGADAARESAQLAQSGTEVLAQSATGVAKDLHGATHRLAEASPDFGQALADLVGEQTRQGVDTLGAFARAVNWTDVVQAQSKLVAGSFVRISQFNARYSELILRGMTATARLPRH